MPKQLKDAAEVVMGYSPPGETCNASGVGVPLLNGPTEFGPHHPTPVQFTTEPRRLAQPGDLLFCVRGSTTGRMNWADQQYAIGRGVAAIRHKETLERQPVVRAAIEKGLPSLLALATGSTFPSLSRVDIESVPYPDLGPASEDAIAGVLGALDEKIEQNRRTARALERLARAIFRAWFVDFEPVRHKAALAGGGAKAAGAASFPSMPQAAFDALPTRLVDSAIGPVPEGWEVGTLSDVARQVRDGVKPSEIDPATPYIGLEHMPRRSITLAEWEHAGKVTSGKSRFKAGQILFGKLRPYFHKVGVAPIDGVCSTDIVVVEPKAADWFGLVLGHVSGDDFVAHTTACSTGTKMPRTNWGDMAGYPIAVPPSGLAGLFTEAVAPMVERLRQSVFESQRLAELRDLLLPKLLSGEVRALPRDAALTSANARFTMSQ